MLNVISGCRASRGLTWAARKLACYEIRRVTRICTHRSQGGFMADIKNYSLNFVSGRRALRGLTCAACKLAYDEVQRVRGPAGVAAYG
jgi:hypothetical protein